MEIKRFNKILIANRGEIALRILRATQDLGKIASVVYAYDDRDLPFVKEANEAFCLGRGQLSETYLNGEKIIQIARQSGADAIHPGYGFLAENPNFAEHCMREGITFIGPTPGVIAIMGDKSMARKKAQELGLPLLTGFTGKKTELIKKAESYPYPVLIKPSAGGGGKGMRIVHRLGDFDEAAMEAAREAENYFGSPDLYVEQYLLNPRHIEVQVLADHHGKAVHLFERECSIQRRYQKIIEEAPSLSLTPELRRAICTSALDLLKGTSYTNAGTVEFLLDENGAFYFLEMNTRIQVEHPVTEKITGFDLVKEQINIAEGKALSFHQEDIQRNGHAIEARIYAEDPLKDFQPSSGSIFKFLLPDEDEIRIDYAYKEGNKVASFYDPMMAKVIAHGTDRKDAINKLITSLKKIHITGISTNRDYLISLLKSPHFAENHIHTNLLDQKSEHFLEKYRESRDNIQPENLVALAVLISLQPGRDEGTKSLSTWHEIGHWRLLTQMTLIYQGKDYLVGYKEIKGRKIMRLSINGKVFEAHMKTREANVYRICLNDQVYHLRASGYQSEILLDMDGHIYPIKRSDQANVQNQGLSTAKNKLSSDRILAPLNGRIIKINHREGEKIEKDQPLLIIESMKMENKILAPKRSMIKKTHVSEGELVFNKQLLITLDIDDRSTDQ